MPISMRILIRSEHAGREHVPANDFREILARHGSGIARYGMVTNSRMPTS